MSSKQRKKHAYVVAVVILVGVGASASVGLTDAGQIDVAQTIEARNERIRTNTTDINDTLTSTVSVPVQTGNQNEEKKADGGLVGLKPSGSAPKPAAQIQSEAAGDVATSSDVTASSTDASATAPSEAEEVSEETATTSEEVVS